MIFQLDFQSTSPIYRQLRDQVVLAIAQGQLTPGERLPTTRALAEDAGVNVMTVSKAYQLLKSEGYLVTDRRRGMRPAGQGADPGAGCPTAAAGRRSPVRRAEPGSVFGCLPQSLW